MIQARIRNVPSRVALGAIGACELVIAGLARLSPSRTADIVGTAAESNVVGSVLAALSLVGNELSLLATVAGVLFFGYAVYTFLPELFPDRTDAITQRHGYRLLATAVVLGVAEVFRWFLAANLFASTRVIVAFLVSGLPLVIIFGYVTSLSYRDAVNTAPAVRAVNERLDISGSDAAAADIDAHSRGQRLSELVMLTLLLATPLPFLAVGIVVVGRLYPLPEVAAIGWVVFGAIEPRLNADIHDRLRDRTEADLETSVFNLAVNTVRSNKGIPVVMTVIIGFAFSGLLIGVLNSNLGRFVREAVAAIGVDPLFAWSVLGMSGVLLGAGLFALWFWTRVIRRVPQYLHAWNDANAGDSPLAGQDLPDAPPRPVGLLVPVTVTIIPAATFTQLLRFDFYFGQRGLLVGAYAVIWPLSLAVLAYCVHRTRTIDPQPPLSDGRALPIALFAEFCILFVLSPIVSFVGHASGMRYVPGVADTGVMLFVFCLTLFMLLHSDLTARSDGQDGWRGNQHHLFMFASGVLGLLGALLNVFPRWGLFVGITGVLFMSAPIVDVAGEKVG